MSNEFANFRLVDMISSHMVNDIYTRILYMVYVIFLIYRIHGMLYALFLKKFFKWRIKDLFFFYFMKINYLFFISLYVFFLEFLG